MNTSKNIQIVEGDLNIAEHAEGFLKLTGAYMADPMGKADAWSDEQKAVVIREMKDHPCALILFAKVDGQIVGICTCFYAYSTFLAKPLLNIHDIYVDESFRANGIAKKLIQSISEIAEKENCGKITLEVRRDNLNARDLYKDQGFKEAPHSMFFWIKYL
ncbi:MAG: GNAT family N-acetyltransferase [Cyclobacteriaceae bacterium]|jgi:ribosomal protein S18 acetylase RimI-like enzyme|nr:GNAT family N-acetyltransferase [Cyclobacteriaceae bacterium]